MESVEGGAWWLAAHNQFVDPQVGKFEFVRVRPLSGDELGRARRANTVLSQLAYAAPYAHLKELYDCVEVLGRHRGLDRRLIELNQTVRAMGRLAEEMPSVMRAVASGEAPVSGEQAVEVEQAIAEETARSPYKLLLVMSALEQGPFAHSGDGFGIAQEVVAALAVAIPEVHPGLNLFAGLRDGVVVAQRLLARQLLAYRELIVRESLYLRQLAAEVPYGTALMMRFDMPLAGAVLDGTQQTTVQPEPLVLDKAQNLHFALAHARGLLDSTQKMKLPRLPARATAQQPEPSGEPPAPAGDQDSQTVDLRALVAHATELTEDLERAWSNALNTVKHDGALQDLIARYESLINTVQRRVLSGDRALRDAGINIGLPPEVLPPDQMMRIGLDAEGRQLWLQRQLAEIDTLVGLAVALNAVRAPSARRVFFDGREPETWWEAGAFMLLRERAVALGRIAEQASQAEVMLTGRAAQAAPLTEVIVHLDAAGAALGRGDTLAVLLHAHRALFARARTSSEAAPTELLSRLADAMPQEHEGHILRLLGEAVARMGTGAAFDIGAAILAAPRALEIVTRLCLQQPAFLESVLGGEGDDGENGS